MNHERLEMMRVLMERVAAQSWQPLIPAGIGGIDLASWKGHSPHCGFTACAVGHACFDEHFNQLGLKWAGSFPSFNGMEAWESVEKFFEIDEALSVLLFLDNGYTEKDRERVAHLPQHLREAKMVANHITELFELGEVAFRQKYYHRVRDYCD